MRILIGMTRSDTVASGSFKHIVQIGERFRKEGITVAYAIGKSGPATQYLKERNFKVYEMQRLERDLNVIKDLLSLLQLIFIICRFRPSLCSWHTAKIGALGRIASMLTLRKSYYVPHGIPFFRSEHNKGHEKYRKLERLLGILPGTIIGVCNYDTQQYLELGIAKRKTLTIHNGMRTVQERDLEPKHGERVRFVTAARFEDQKDYITLAKAVHQLAEYSAEFELHIYGDGRQEQEVRALFADVQGAKIYFAGVIEDLTTALVKSDVFVLSSHWEGLPRTIIEAMSCSMPVIATDVGGVAELVEHQRTGYLIPPGGAEELYQSMRVYMDDPARIAEHGRTSYRKFKTEYTLDKMLTHYITEYLPPVAISTEVIGERASDA